MNVQIYIRYKKRGKIKKKEKGGLNLDACNKYKGVLTKKQNKKQKNKKKKQEEKKGICVFLFFLEEKKKKRKRS